MIINKIRARITFNLIIQQLAQHLHCYVLMFHVFNFKQKFFRQDRNIGFFQSI